MSSLLTFGEAMGIFVADGIGTLDHARGFTLGVAGAESNVAMGVARLGGDATWLGRLGKDATGSLIATRLRSSGVRVIALEDDAFTGLMIRYRRSGQFIHADYHRAGSAGSRLNRSDVPEAEIAAASILHVTGITPALSDSCRSAVFAAVETARSAGVTVSVDVNYRSKLWSTYDAAPVLRDLVSRADVVFAGPDEAAIFLGSADPVEGLAGLGPSEVIVKDGARGCVALIDGSRFSLPAMSVSSIDPVGAGDAFVAGYLADRLAGLPAANRLRTAIEAGAFAVTVPGDCEGLPTRADLQSLSGTDINR
ncbi:2-dehydro-3-deoxygluconokinase [Actinoplanes lutulentus]|uniref:2-dehydro-3-deoxygluconokinase n=1 Tax=Actinoplanes lutulentus TaxID=1287878 RepID=A0A327ZCW0_9ACTN|nr:sugar kinase [Actinoplanes lutulentus]MBB2942645.1 2-dehydro-3-deoxygluconokinase [Actinoplanes lutulentus]RAK38226.1 2-dehydro-3-deoxygluconokinase [Actinoplanes lutulentus]